MDKWIRDISDLHRAKPPPSVNYRQPMPDVDRLMQVGILAISRVYCPLLHQEWPKEVEAMLGSMPLSFPDVELETLIDLQCGLLDIPVQRSRLEALHLLFSLYLATRSAAHLYTRPGDKRSANRGFLDPL